MPIGLSGGGRGGSRRSLDCALVIRALCSICTLGGRRRRETRSSWWNDRGKDEIDFDTTVACVEYPGAALSFLGTPGRGIHDVGPRPR